LIFIDTSALVGSLTGERHSGEKLIALLREGEQVQISSLVLYEWLRGPRTSQELLQQEKVFPREAAVVFGPEEAARAADLYKRVPRARSREVDLAIAATAIVRDAALWTLNPEDFRDIPELKLV
jgi:predicted nucleic acid-binding protein